MSLTPSVSEALFRRRRTRTFGILSVVLVAAFARPLWDWVQLALHYDLHSHILLVPVISVYLFRTAAKPFRFEPGLRSFAPAVISAACGLLALGIYFSLARRGPLAPPDAVALLIFSFLLLLLANALANFGWAALKPRLFPICFLIFMLPLPTAVFEAASVALQKASADVSEVMLRATGMPVLRSGMMMHLPGLKIIVAEECSGIRSTYVLFITSFIASHLFLRSGWKKAVLIGAILPIAILRNAFRIATISWLTVNVDAGIIHSPLHHRGGPLFFVLSLIPLFLLLWWLRKSEIEKPDGPRNRELPLNP